MITEDIVNILLQDNSLRYIRNGYDHHYWVYKDYTCFELHFDTFRGLQDGFINMLDESELLEQVHQSKLHIDSIILQEKEMKYESLLQDIKKDFR